MSPRRRAEWQLSAWFIFMLAFVWVGSLPIGMIRHLHQVRDQGPTNSTDATLASDLGCGLGIRSIKERLARLPRGSNVAVVFQPGSYQTVSSQIISLAIWSDDRRAVQLHYTNSESPIGLQSADFDAAFILGNSPPWMPAGSERLGSQLCFVQKTTAAR